MNGILHSIKSSTEGRKKTQIMQSANSNRIQTKKYLKYMPDYGFLVVTERETYALTEKDSKLLLVIEMQKIQSLR
jgi:predicted transcriptional regulator